MDLYPSERISKRSTGQFNPKNWFSEGDGLLASSTKTREIWTNHRETFSKTVQERQTGNRDRADDWNLLTGLPRASMLLLGYSVEMYLKAGLAKAYYGCSEEMFNRDVKNRFGHKLVPLAKEIAFVFVDEDEKNLNLLKDMILFDARYPISAPKGLPGFDAVNQQTGRIWSSKTFEVLIELANRIKEHSGTIDANSKNPAFLRSFNVDEDGYLLFRVGGNLPPRITYRLSSVQERECKTSLDDVKALFVSPQFQRLRCYWDRAWIYEDGKKKTRIVKTPT